MSYTVEHLAKQLIAVVPGTLSHQQLYQFQNLVHNTRTMLAQVLIETNQVG